MCVTVTISLQWGFTPWSEWFVAAAVVDQPHVPSIDQNSLTGEVMMPLGYFRLYLLPITRASLCVGAVLLWLCWGSCGLVLSDLTLYFFFLYMCVHASQKDRCVFVLSCSLGLCPEFAPVLSSCLWCALRCWWCLFLSLVTLLFLSSPSSPLFLSFHPPLPHPVHRLHTSCSGAGTSYPPPP